MQLACASALNQSPQLLALATQLGEAATIIGQGAAVMRSVDLGSYDWPERFNLATKESSRLWSPAFAGRAALEAAAQALDASVPTGMAGRDAVRGALAVASRELDNMGRIYMQYSMSPAQHRAVAAAGSVAACAERVIAAYTVAQQRLVELAMSTT
jgi:hypothetical protein